MELNITKTTEISESMLLSALTIAEGSELTVPAGKTLTLTVDGVEKEIKPGHFEGDVALTVCDGFGRAGGMGPPGAAANYFRGALYIDKDGVNQAKSVLPSVMGGKYDGSGLEGVKIVSDGPLFGGVSVDGAKYSIKDLDIKMNGFGGNDFTGEGAGFAASGNAEVEVENMTIHSDGVIRIGTIVTDTAKVHFKNCDVTCTGGTLEEQLEAEERTEGRGNMCKVPWMLGTMGNCRATSVLTKGTAIYENCRLRSASWGVLSTDGTSSVKDLSKYSIYLEAKNCLIENTEGIGYGAFSIGACKELFTGCTFNAGTYALIQANETACAKFEGCVVNSNKFGTMTYSNQGGAIEVKDSTFNTEKASFVVKGAYPQIICENSVLNSREGVIIQLMDCDDPMYGPYGELLDAPSIEKVEGHDLTKANLHDITIFGVPSKDHCTDLQASFKDMTIKGDFYNSVTNTAPISAGFAMPDPEDMPEMPEGMPPMDAPAPDMGSPDPTKGGGSPDPTKGGMPEMPKMKPASDYPINMVLDFKNTSVTGVISASKGKHAYEKSSQEHWDAISVVSNTPAPAVNNGVVVSLDGSSSWTVTGDSYITALNLAEGAVVKGSMTVDGVETAILPGSYTGNIVLKA